MWSPSLQEGYLRINGLAPNDPRILQYQLWIFDKRRDDRFPVDGGVFDIAPTGEVVIKISPKLFVAEPVLFAITIEPPGGVVVSKRERIVVTAAPAKGSRGRAIAQSFRTDAASISGVPTSHSVAVPTSVHVFLEITHVAASGVHETWPISPVKQWRFSALLHSDRT